ncbi:hypothetical protein LCGC14_1376810 [marine sediment metagenome]|uniref:Uncharacterized protein n=1 Tax=marine sediment metagenome TaxID=412755 RepID=A0A0F9KPT7_9ZZZZ
MTVSNYIDWRGMKIPKITHGARIDILASDVPYYGQFVYEDGIRIAFPPGLIAFAQIVLDDHYEAYPVNPEGGVLFEGFEPVVIVAHTPPPGLANFSAGAPFTNPMPNCPCLLEDTKLPPQCDYEIREQDSKDIPDPPPITQDWDDPDYC